MIYNKSQDNFYLNKTFSFSKTCFSLIESLLNIFSKTKFFYSKNFQYSFSTRFSNDFILKMNSRVLIS